MAIEYLKDGSFSTLLNAFTDNSHIIHPYLVAMFTSAEFGPCCHSNSELHARHAGPQPKQDTTELTCFSTTVNTGCN